MLGKGYSIYQRGSENNALHESNHFEGGKIEKDLARPGFELRTFTLKGQGAIHYTMAPW